jgi:bacillithiol system protein YtxJ
VTTLKKRLGYRSRLEVRLRTALAARVKLQLGVGVILGRGRTMTMTWHLKPMATTADFEAALAASDSRATWLLKHSNSCGVSEEALAEFAAHADEQRDDMHWVLTVQRSPALSRLIAAQLGVAHDTPQVILLFERQARWVATHWDVSLTSLHDALAILSS